MNAAVIEPDFRRLNPQRLLGRIDATGPGGLILRRLCAYHPKPVSQSDLMEGAGLSVRLNPVLAPASFHWHVLRLNDELKDFGWTIAESGTLYRLAEVE